MKEFEISESQKTLYFAKIMLIMLDGEITKDGILIYCNEEKIKEIVFRNHYFTKEELVTMRNNFVYVISELMNNSEDNIEAYEKYNSIMMIVTEMIDSKIMEGVV